MTESPNLSAHNIAWKGNAKDAPVTPGNNPLEEPVPAVSAALEAWPAADAPMVEFALYYARRGWHVFPCTRKVPLTPRDKVPTATNLKEPAVSTKRQPTKIRSGRGGLNIFMRSLAFALARSRACLRSTRTAPRGWQTGTRLSHRMAVSSPDSCPPHTGRRKAPCFQVAC
jgi:hypothetical protein